MQSQEPKPDAQVTSKPEPRRPGRPSWQKGRLRNRRTRLALALGAGIMALLCLGGVGVFVALYDEATEINRTAPKVVVISFLGAFFVNENDQEAALYQCESGGDFSQLVEFRDDTVRREREHSVGISVTWSNLQETTNSGEGVVSADLVRTIAGQKGRDSAPWEFTLVDQDGWRVCGARPV